MTHKLSFIFFLGFLLFSSCAQTKDIPQYNFDFEDIINNTPKGWNYFGSAHYKSYIDNQVSKHGKNAIVIENNSDSAGFKALSFQLPHNYKGKEIKLKGWIKTEDVREGFAGLWMRIDPLIGFDNMHDRGVTGTTDWQQYEITLSLSPEKTDQIFIGGLLVGKGKMWLDNLEIIIDGKNLTKEKIDIFISDIPATNDKEFDKGSKISLNKINDEQLKNLELLGRIWGFLKYHHPAIAKGEYNWDYELFRILPEYLKVSNAQDRDILLVEWIQKYGHVTKTDYSAHVTDKILIKSNTEWIDKISISRDLKNILHQIYANRNQSDNYYIALFPGVGNPEFKNEKLYENMPFPDTGFRLLALYKYWNMIEYFFPYKYLTDKKWDTILSEYIPLMVEAEDELAYEIVITLLIGDINDSHAYVNSGNDKIQILRGFKNAPFEVKFIENKLVITDYYNAEFSRKSNLKIGDIITHINEKTVESIVDSLRPYYRSSNENATRRTIAREMLRSTKELIDIKYISNNKQETTKLQLYNDDEIDFQSYKKARNSLPVFKILEDSIGYFALENVKHNDVDKLRDTLSSLKGVIIDIRKYPNQFVALNLASLFVSKPTDFVKFSKGNINNPSEFNFMQGPIIQPNKYSYYNRNRKLFEGKVVVLVNEYTQSQAEYTTMAIRSTPNSLIIGSQTSGADGNYSHINLPGGIKTGITGIGVYYPDGRETQRIGLIPNIEVKPTIKGIRNGKDELLLKAIEIINKR